MDRARWKGALAVGGATRELYYMRSRWYEPHSGRFLSEDPVGLVGGLNPYTYVGNDPVNGIDPSGLAGCKVWADVNGKQECVELDGTRLADAEFTYPSGPNVDPVTVRYGWGVTPASPTGVPTLQPVAKRQPGMRAPVIGPGTGAVTTRGLNPACASAGALFAVTVLADATSVAGGVGVLRLGVFAWTAAANARVFAANPAVRTFLVVPAIEASNAYSSLGAHALSLTASSSVQSSAQIGLWSLGATGSGPSPWDFIPIVASYRAFNTVRDKCNF